MLDQLKRKFNNDKKHMFAIMVLVHETKMTNDSSKIMHIYQQNKERCILQIPGGETEVKRLLSDFFSSENIALRLLLLRDEINQSRRKGNVTLLAFFINVQNEDRLYYMIHKKGEKHDLDVDPKESESEEEEPAKDKAAQQKQAVEREKKRELRYKRHLEKLNRVNGSKALSLEEIISVHLAI